MEKILKAWRARQIKVQRAWRAVRGSRRKHLGRRGQRRTSSVSRLGTAKDAAANDPAVEEATRTEPERAQKVDRLPSRWQGPLCREISFERVSEYTRRFNSSMEAA